jgi:hypothetical protein
MTTTYCIVARWDGGHAETTTTEPPSIRAVALTGAELAPNGTDYTTEVYVTPTELTDDLVDTAWSWAESYIDQGEPIDWESVIDRIEGATIHWGEDHVDTYGSGVLDLGNDPKSPLIRALKRAVSKRKRELDDA